MMNKIKNLSISKQLFIFATFVLLDTSFYSIETLLSKNSEVIPAFSENSTILNDKELGSISDNTIEFVSIDIDELAYENYLKLKEEIEENENENEEDKEYSGMALSHEYEDFIIETAEEYNVPAEVMLCLGNIETGGTWDVDPEKQNGNFGNFQINWCNVEQIHYNFNRYATIEETRYALIYDEEFNAEAATWLVTRILECNHCQSFQSLCMSYNGSYNKVNYAYACVGIMDKYFPGKLDEVEEKIKNYEKLEEPKKYNPQLENDILANKLDRKNVKRLV